MSEPDETVSISVIIVHYKVLSYLQQCLRALQDAEGSERCEIIVVDNASDDNIERYIQSNFPNVTLIALKQNIGFGRACNIGSREAKGRYLLLLNPDTIVSKDTLITCFDFMEQYHKAGIVGPKILNSDGSLQESCRRSFPTPASAFFHFIGLSRLFPRNKKFGRYNLTYLPADKKIEVDAVSGSFMFMRAELYHELNGFDEHFFLYGEDLDLCARVKQKGYSIWYYPDTQIIHFKGKSTSKLKLRSRISFYHAMLLFSKKYHHTYGTFYPRIAIFAGIVLQGFFNILLNFFHTFIPSLVDLTLVNLILWGTMHIRFFFSETASPYSVNTIEMVIFMHLLVSFFFLATFASRKIYLKSAYSSANLIFSCTIASLFFATFTLLTQWIAFSRIVLLLFCIITGFFLYAWRELLPRIFTGIKKLSYSTGNALIIGNNTVATRLLRHIEHDKSAYINGIIWPDETAPPPDFLGYPVLGNLHNLSDILEVTKTDIVLIATQEHWYSHVIQALSSDTVKHITIRWAPQHILEMPAENLPDTIPLEDFVV